MITTQDRTRCVFINMFILHLKLTFMKIWKSLIVALSSNESSDTTSTHHCDTVVLVAARCVAGAKEGGGVSRARGHGEDHVYHTCIHAFPNEAWTPSGAQTLWVNASFSGESQAEPRRTTSKQPPSNDCVRSGAGLNVSKSLVLQ